MRLARFYVLTVRCLGPDFASNLLMLFGLLSVGVAVPFIMVQRSSRRMLAYSSIEHGGIMVLGLGFGGALGVLGMLLHMTYHSVTKPLLFFSVGNAQQHTGNDSRRKGAGGLCMCFRVICAHVSSWRSRGHRDAALQHVPERVHGASCWFRRSSTWACPSSSLSASWPSSADSSITSRSLFSALQAEPRENNSACGKDIQSSGLPWWSSPSDSGCPARSIN